MIITLTPNPAPGGMVPTPYLLAAGGRAGVSNLVVRDERSSQTAQYLRALTAGEFDRGNRRTQLTFEVTRQFKSVAAAQNFLVDHAALCPSGGLLVITNELDAGGVPQRFGANALLTRVRGSHAGATTRHTYEITVPFLTMTRPM